MRPFSLLVCSLLSLSPLACASSNDGAAPASTEDAALTEDARPSTDAVAEETVADAGPAAPDARADAPAEAGPTDAKVAVAKFDADAATKICARLASCCSEADARAFFKNFTAPPYTLTTDKLPTTAECVPTLKAQLAVLHDRWVASIGRGRMSFDPTKAAACLAAVDAAACGPALSTALFDPACFGVRDNLVFQKLGKLGDTCQDLGDSTFFGECNPELGYCDGPASKVSDRRCVAWRKEGEACSALPTWQFCDTRRGAVCEGGSASAPGKCSRNGKTIPVGGACGATTGPIDECAKGAYCDDTTRKCAASKKDGEACHWNDECASAYPYSCFPADPLGAGGKCGSKAFCGGK